MTVRTHDLTLLNLRKHSTLAAYVTAFGKIELFHPTHVIELHHPRRVLHSAVDTWSILGVLNKSFHLGSLLLSTSKILILVGVVVLQSCRTGTRVEWVLVGHLDSLPQKVHRIIRYRCTVRPLPFPALQFILSAKFDDEPILHLPGQRALESLTVIRFALTDRASRHCPDLTCAMCATMVEMMGFEPTTYSVQGSCLTVQLHPHEAPNSLDSHA